MLRVMYKYIIRVVYSIFFTICNQTAACKLASSLCVFRIIVTLTLTYPRSKHVALLDTQTLLSKYSCVLTDTCF